VRTDSTCDDLCPGFDGNGYETACFGHGNCDAATGLCECDGLYVSSNGCETEYNIVKETTIGFVTFVGMVVLFGVFLHRRGLEALSSRIDKKVRRARGKLDDAAAKPQANEEKNEQQTLTTSNELCASAVAITIISTIMLFMFNVANIVSQVMFDMLKFLLSVMLVIESWSMITDVPQQLQDFFDSIATAFGPISDLFSWFSGVFSLLDLDWAIVVECPGASVGFYLAFNVSLFILLCLIVNSK
jgi:hypothetical protein